MNATNLDSSKSYTIDVSTDDTGIGFDSNCTVRDQTETVPSNSPHTISLTLYGMCHRRRNSNRTHATLSRDGSTVDTDTHSLTVTTPPPPPTPTIRISELVSPNGPGR